MFALRFSIVAPRRLLSKPPGNHAGHSLREEGRTQKGAIKVAPLISFICLYVGLDHFFMSLTQIWLGQACL